MAVTCSDQQILQLDLRTVLSTGAINTALDGGAFYSHIDAQAGGLNPTESYVYARFTPSGLEKVDLQDEAALTSTTWDIAFRRYVIRVNSGVSGPSCVTVGRTAPGTLFVDLTTTPAGLQYRTEEYFTATCDLVSDGTGIGGPGTALASYWTYQSCLQMTKNVYVVQLADARHVKVEVLGYYDLDKQAVCDATGNVPQPSNAANFRIRWAFIP